MRLSAVLLLFKEQPFVEACVRAIYPVVDSICVATQYDRNLAGDAMTPDQSLSTLLQLPDPQNKIRLTVQRELSSLPGLESESRLRNAALRLDPQADYYLIIDSDEIWTEQLLRQCWDHVQKTKWSGYKVSSYTYFRQWNYRIVEPGDGYRPFVFLRRGFNFKERRQVDWHSSARWKDYFRKGRKPKTVYFPPSWRLHHGSCVGDDIRILTKINNYSHSTDIDPAWYERVWLNFHPGITNFHYFTGCEARYESLTTVPTQDLPEEITRCTWPEGWIDRKKTVTKKEKLRQIL